MNNGAFRPELDRPNSRVCLLEGSIRASGELPHECRARGLRSTTASELWFNAWLSVRSLSACSLRLTDVADAFGEDSRSVSADAAALPNVPPDPRAACVSGRKVPAQCSCR